MDLNSLKSIFKSKKGDDGKNTGGPVGKNQGKGASGSNTGRNAASGRNNAQGRNSAPARISAPGRIGVSGRSQPGSPGRGKIAPVSPSRARLEKRANDEKIIKNIKIIFTTIVSVAIVGILVSIFLYVYKPTVATVAGMGIEQFEFVYQLKLTSMYSSEYSTVGTISQQAINGAAQTKMMEILAKERGISITPEDRDEINYMFDYIDQMAMSDSSGMGGRMTGDDYLRETFGITKSQYRKIMESEIHGRKLVEQEYENLVIPEEDARLFYDYNIDQYEEATVRHILFFYEGPSEDEPRTREESERLANDTVARILAGEDMAELVQELSEDGDLTNEGIYTFNRGENFEQGFKDWTFDPTRQTGDVGICETAYGYHVMRLEDLVLSPFEDVMDEIIEDLESEHVDMIIENWKNDPRFQLQTNERVFETVVKEVFG